MASGPASCRNLGQSTPPLEHVQPIPSEPLMLDLGLHCMRGQSFNIGACHVKLNKKNVALIICGFNTFQERSNRHIGSFPIQKMPAHKKTYEKDTQIVLSPKNKILLETAPPKKKHGKNHHGTPILDPMARVSSPPAPLVPTSCRSRSIR